MVWSGFKGGNESYKIIPPSVTQPHFFSQLHPLHPISLPLTETHRHSAASSLLVLTKHIVLFAFHVLKVKVGACHTPVDVLDVITSGLKMGGGIIRS